MGDEPRLTDRELDAMSILWRHGSGTVNEVRDRLTDDLVHGSASMLLAQLVAERRLPPEELRRMRELLDERLADQEDA